MPLSAHKRCVLGPDFTCRKTRKQESQRVAIYKYVHAMFRELWELERFQTAKVAFKVMQGH